MSKNMMMRVVMQNAWAFVRDNGMTLSNALKVAWKNFKLKSMMMAGKAVKFTFQKVDGTIRTALGTLAQAAINYIPNGNGHSAPDTVQRFWDLENGGYRSFRKANLVDICL